MKNIYIFLLLAVFSCRQPQEQSSDSVSEEKNKPVGIEDAHHFYVLGDWGRNGMYGQKAVARQMAQTANDIEPKFVISTGDNFYPNGVASIMDPLWDASYEDIYTHPHLHCNWYVCMGNHDIRGAAEAQIEYTHVSRRWNMPDRYFSFEKMLEDDSTKVLFAFIDTNPFQYTDKKSKYYPMVKGLDTLAQKKWLTTLLDSSSAKWKIVVGHHPVYTGGKRIDVTQPMINAFRNLFEAYSVDMYFCGHEHDLQVLKEEKGNTVYVVSGAGSEIRETGEMEHSRFSASENGFFITSATKDSLYVQAVDTLNNVLFDYVVKK